MNQNKEGHRGGLSLLSTGADGRTRTGDLLITNQLLYQLSYIGDAAHLVNATPGPRKQKLAARAPFKARALARSGAVRGPRPGG